MENATTSHKINYEHFLITSLSYESYLAQLQQIVATRSNNLSPDSAYTQYLPINLTRMQRIAKTSQLSKELLSALASLKNKVYWLVITEHWCGDAAQSLPLIHKIAEASEGKIVLRILYRDKYPGLMEHHLTNGASAIPKLIQLNSDFTFLGDWGPRPKPAQELVKR